MSNDIHLPGMPMSVTTIIKRALPSPKLEQWKQQRVAELARIYVTEDVTGLLDRHPQVDSAERGTRLHGYIEDYLRRGVMPMPDETVPYDQHLWDTWYMWWSQQELTPLAPEVTVWHPDLQYAGRVDLMATDPGSNAVVCDWKTARRLPKEPYMEHVAQIAGYLNAKRAVLEDRFNPNPGRISDPKGEWDYQEQSHGEATTFPIHWEGGCGLIVYVSRDGLRAFMVDGALLARGLLAFNGAVQICQAMYPEEFL